MRRCFVHYFFSEGKGKKKHLEERKCEAVSFSDGSFYLHGASIVPPEFDSVEEFVKFADEHYDSCVIEWIDEVAQ